jgi:hypothetical protein
MLDWSLVGIAVVGAFFTVIAGPFFIASHVHPKAIAEICLRCLISSVVASVGNVERVDLALLLLTQALETFPRASLLSFWFLAAGEGKRTLPFSYAGWPWSTIS